MTTSEERDVLIECTQAAESALDYAEGCVERLRPYLSEDVDVGTQPAADWALFGSLARAASLVDEAYQILSQVLPG